MYNPPLHAKPLDLHNPFLKIKRAKDHIDNLKVERIRFVGNNRYFGVPQYNAETDSTKFSLEYVPEIPPCIRLILGDIAHNLRTALDHLACEIARSMGIAEPTVYFPICETEKVYKAESGRKTKGLPKEAKDFIDTIGPYGGHDDLLWGLHELDRIDKHRLVLTTTARTNTWSATLTQGSGEHELSFGFSSALKAGDKIAELSGKHESDKEVSVTLDIAFGEPDVFKGEPLFPRILFLAEHVERVISSFGATPP